MLFSWPIRFLQQGALLFRLEDLEIRSLRRPRCRNWSSCGRPHFYKACIYSSYRLIKKRKKMIQIVCQNITELVTSVQATVANSVFVLQSRRGTRVLFLAVVFMFLYLFLHLASYSPLFYHSFFTTHTLPQTQNLLIVCVMPLMFGKQIWPLKMKPVRGRLFQYSTACESLTIEKKAFSKNVEPRVLF